MNAGSNHKVKITGSDFYCFIVRVDKDGEESVVNGFGRHFASRQDATKGAIIWMNKRNLQHNEELAIGVQS